MCAGPPVCPVDGELRDPRDEMAGGDDVGCTDDLPHPVDNPNPHPSAQRASPPRTQLSKQLRQGTKTKPLSKNLPDPHASHLVLGSMCAFQGPDVACLY